LRYQTGSQVKRFFAEHRNEQVNKAKAIIEESKEFRKVMVVAHYREQIDQLKKELSKDQRNICHLWRGKRSGKDN